MKINLNVFFVAETSIEKSLYHSKEINAPNAQMDFIQLQEVLD
jgi:hypothetical protein